VHNLRALAQSDLWLFLAMSLRSSAGDKIAGLRALASQHKSHVLATQLKIALRIAEQAIPCGLKPAADAAQTAGGFSVAKYSRNARLPATIDSL
jgi:hypothetical protein